MRRVFPIALATLALVAGPSRVAAEEGERAHVVFERAEALFAAGNYDAARSAYEHLYALLDGHAGRHVVLFNVGQCYERAFAYAEAVAAYRRYLAEGGDAEDDAEEVRRRITLLSAMLGAITLHTAVQDARVLVDGRPAVRDGARYVVAEGTHLIEVRAEGREPLTLRRTIRSGETIRIDYAGARTVRRSRPTAFAAVATSTGVLAISAMGLGVVAQRRHDALASREGEDAFLSYLDGETPARFGRAANALFITAGFGALAAAILVPFTDFGARTRAAGAPELGLGPGSVDLRWRF